MCLYPRIIKNRKYVINKKNGGNVPNVPDSRVQFVPVGCQNCMECKKKQAREWQVRLHEEIRERKDGQFVTLSFSDESLVKLENVVGFEVYGYKKENAVATLAVRRFLERWRKKYKKSCRHWLVTELGQKNTERIHIHGILFTSESKETIEKIWKYGNVYIGDYVNEKTINYIVKYISKSDIKHKEYKAKILTTPGIGKGYLKRKDSTRNKFNGDSTKEYYKTRQGIKLALPIYYRNHIYNEEEREKLWLQKLDEEVRYINGVKIDVSKGTEIYDRRLEQEQKKNAELGYGKLTNWAVKKYEEQQREIKREERLKKVSRNGAIRNASLKKSNHNTA